jgi:hypothetical protein
MTRSKKEMPRVAALGLKTNLIHIQKILLSGTDYKPEGDSYQRKNDGFSSSVSGVFGRPWAVRDGILCQSLCAGEKEVAV